MIDRVDTANSFIREGNFEKARKIYSDLLDADPEDLSFIAGFFISSYWDNRLELVLRIREGKERGRKFVSLFEEFDREIRERKYPLAEPYQAATQCILGEASFHFKLAYQKEGNMGLEPAVLTELALCLIRTGDYKNASDILAYGQSLKKSAQNTFYRAECLFFMDKEKEGKAAYMEGFLSDPSVLHPEIIHSEPLRTAIATIARSFEKTSDMKEYLPVYCLEKKLLPVLGLEADFVKNLFREISRLHDNLQKSSSHKFKLSCRILVIGIHILENTSAEEEINEKTRSMMMEAEPDFLNRFYSI